MLLQTWRLQGAASRASRFVFSGGIILSLVALCAPQAGAAVTIADNWAHVVGGGGESYYDGFISFAGNTVDAPVNNGGNLYGKFINYNTYYGQSTGMAYINTLLAPDQFNANDTLRLTIDTTGWNWLHLSLQADYTTSDAPRTGQVTGSTGWMLEDSLIPVTGNGGIHVVDIPLSAMNAGSANPRYVDPGGYNNGIPNVFAYLGLWFQMQGGATPGGYDSYYDPNYDNGFDPDSGDPLPPGHTIDDSGTLFNSHTGPPTTPVQGGHVPYILIDKIELLSAVGNNGDLDDDGDVDSHDIDTLWNVIRPEVVGSQDPNNNDTEDLNNDGFVNEKDVDYMLRNLLTAGTGRAYGDADLDGGVGGLDYTAWRVRAGTGWANGDFDGDGGVGGLDYTLWRTRPTAYPGTVGPHGSGPQVVPEPASLVLLGLGLPAFLGLIARRRR